MNQVRSQEGFAAFDPQPLTVAKNNNQNCDHQLEMRLWPELCSKPHKGELILLPQIS